MKKRIIISETQFDRLIKKQVLENVNKGVIEEGPKEWLLAGLLTLSSLAGLAQTKKTTEYDENRIKVAELVQKKIEKGDEDVYQLFDKANIDLNKQNLDKLKSVDIDGVKMDVIKTGSKSIAKSKLKQGYVLSDIKISSDTILKRGDAVYMGDTITLDYGSDVAFKTANYELTDSYKQNLLNTINDIVSNNGTITKVTVESSTDKEPIRMGNQKLAELRSNSVLNVLNSMGVENVQVVNLPDQGPNVYTRTMSTQERTEARQETSQHRYVKITIEYEVEVMVPTDETVKEVINKYKYEMVKVTPKQDDTGTYKFKGKDAKRTIHGKSKCKRVKYKNKMIACPVDLMN
jgi:outer membrane protein OmpA-like peptidoglycan-associated protein